VTLTQTTFGKVAVGHVFWSGKTKYIKASTSTAYEHLEYRAGKLISCWASNAVVFIRDYIDPLPAGIYLIGLKDSNKDICGSVTAFSVEEGEVYPVTVIGSDEIFNWEELWYRDEVHFLKRVWPSEENIDV
jgi:hypothetical protein